MMKSQRSLHTSDFDYELPEELIAQNPAAERDQSRLMVLHRSSGQIEHRTFPELLDYLRPGDVMVLNDSKVIPARLRGRKAVGGGRIEILLGEELGMNDWWVMLRPGKRVRPGTRIQILDRSGNVSDIEAGVVEKNVEGHYRLLFEGTADIKQSAEELGEMPLPPYIARPAETGGVEDRDRYQTVFAERAGSAAAPTAGLHFTERILGRIRERGIEIRTVTLHVGLGTFAPVKTERVEDHLMHEESFEVSPAVADVVNRAKDEGRRVLAVGTTSIRVLESVARESKGRIRAGSGRTRIFIYPPYQFQVTDMLLTNFHLPKSTLLMLVSAFAAPNETRGRDLILAAYKKAARERYRFYSYGDAMLIH